jgi:hypothetical protein
VFERAYEVVDGVGSAGEYDTLLDVPAREHGEVGDREHEYYLYKVSMVAGYEDFT